MMTQTLALKMAARTTVRQNQETGKHQRKALPFAVWREHGPADIFISASDTDFRLGSTDWEIINGLF
jgi:hypothetical protein